jgi:MFS family permease
MSSHLKQRLLLFKIQAFRRYALACIIAMLGNGMNYIALTWMVLQFNNSVEAVAIVMFAFWLPSVFLGPFAGVLADRLPRKKLFVAINALRGVILLLFGGYEYWHPSLLGLYGLALAQGVVFSMVIPVLMALIREIVSEDQLLIANATIDIAFEIGNVVGMAFAGFVIAALSVSGTLILDGALFIAAAVLSWGMRMTQAAAPILRSFRVSAVWQDLLDGLNYIRSRRPLVLIYCVQLVMMVAFMTVPILMAPFASNILHANVSQFGMIESSLSIGVVVGGLLLPWLAERVGLLRLICLLLLMLAICFALFGLNRHLLLAEVLNGFIGLGLAVWPLVMTQAQGMTELSYQGRVQASFNALSGVVILSVYSLVDLGSRFLAIPKLYWVEVVLSLLGVLLLLIYLRAPKTAA